MELTEDEIVQRYAKKCGHCNRNTSLLYGYEFTCFSCGFNLIKRKHDVSKIQQEKIDFINRLKMQIIKFFVYALMYIKFLKVIIMTNYMKFYQY